MCIARVFTGKRCQRKLRCHAVGQCLVVYELQTSSDSYDINNDDNSSSTSFAVIDAAADDDAGCALAPALC